MPPLHQQLAAGLLRRLADEVEDGKVTFAAAVAALTALIGAASFPPDALAERARVEHSIPAPAPNPEAVDLVEALERKYGSAEKVCEALGVQPNVLGTWKSGRASAGSLARLREAVNAPLGRGGKPKKKAEGQEVGDAGSEPAGAGPRPGHPPSV